MPQKWVHDLATGEGKFVDLTQEEIEDIRKRKEVAEQAEREDEERRKNEPTIEKAMRMIERLSERINALESEIVKLKSTPKK